jgi:DNA excision repair protein ERCC-2
MAMKIFAAFMTNLMSKNLDLLEPHNLIEPGVFTFGDLLRYCQEKVTCPYFTVRRMVG